MRLGIGSIAFIYDSINKKKYTNSIDLLLNSIEETLKFTENNDLQICEIILDPPEILLSESKRKIISLCKNYHSIKKQFHAPYSDLSLCTHNPWIIDASIDCYVESVKFCKEINAQVFTFHPGDAKFLHHSYNRIKNRLIKSINVLSERITEQDLCLIKCLENMSKASGFFLDYHEISKFFSELEREDIFFTWDTGHSWSCNDNIEKLWEKINKKIKNIHLVDDLGNSIDIHPTLGKGNVNFQKVFEIIEYYNYQEALIIELHDAKNLTESIEYIKKFF